ncbi:hypothetical protein BH24PSE2_BH24PSE2_17860 [soil metagenome]
MAGGDLEYGEVILGDGREYVIIPTRQKPYYVGMERSLAVTTS